MVNIITPKKALNKAFLKVKISRNDLDQFTNNLTKLLDNINENESEEFHKNLVTDFLKNTYYQPNYFINTKGRNDLVIHNGKDAKSTVGVILELKKPANKFVGVNGRSPLHNQKALQELLLYYLRERITANNLEIKHLIVTNVYQWFIFDAQNFDKYFAQNKELVKQFTDFENKRLAIKITDLFYQEIAQKAIALVENELTFTYFDLYPHPPTHHQPKGEEGIDIETRLPSPSGRGVGGEGDSRLPSPSGRGVGGEGDLITLYKIFSPEHFLKLSFVNDSNSLDKNFYNELLYIIGLTEVKQGSKKLIQREKITNRNKSSLLENAITQLVSLSKLHHLENTQEYGETEEEQLFNLGLELVITWVNRILFLKLLESQLINYNCRDVIYNVSTYSFLNLDKIKNYGELNSLFFRVLAVKNNDRDEDIREKFAYIPYLNSSLFEVSDIENKTIVIGNLTEENLPLFSATVLKDNQGKKCSGKINSLQYLFEFLNSYDFGESSPPLKGGLGGVNGGSEILKEDNKTLINASVLGLIFEKINGYKDGSFFTPGFITMYMCRETIRRAILQKFNEIKGWNCENIDQLYDLITDKKEANSIVNNIKICDPAVGSGHFLVSALNELIAIKSELKILLDKEGKTLRDYDIEVVNDELIITDDDGNLFQYNPQSKESQRIQETLFHEKQTLIENCLFGVDINQNSVKICRLRLWIELLKNAYYIPFRTPLDPPLQMGEREKRMLPSPPAPLPQGEGRMLPSPPAPLPQGEGRMLPSPPAPLPQGEGRMLQTLPNLDINIKCGNSLISKFQLNSDLKKVLKQSQSNIESYKNAVKNYKNATNKQEKRELVRLINNLKWTFRDTLTESKPKKAKLRKLAGELYNLEHQISLFEGSKAEKKAREKQRNKLNNEVDKLTVEIEELDIGKIYQKAFEWRFEFPEVLDNEGNFVGFDVIIGNPPYIFARNSNEKGFTLSSKAYLYNNYELAEYQVNLYPLFIEKGCLLLKENGCFAYITPNNWLTINTNKNLRYFILNKSNIKVINCLGQIFDNAAVDTSLIIFDNYKSESKISLLEYTDRFNLIKETETNYFLNQKDYLININILKNDDAFNLINKIENKSVLLKSIADVKSALKAYEIGKGNPPQTKEMKQERIYHSQTQIDKSYLKYLKGKDVCRYYLGWSGEYLKYGKNLAEHKGNFNLFSTPRILVRQIPSKPPYCINASFTEETILNDLNSMNVINITIEPELVLGVLNSRLISYWFVHKFGKLQRGTFPQFKVNELAIFPIPKNLEKQRFNLINLVTQIITLKKSNPHTNTSELEREIDLLVYELYGLTEEEIAIIENNLQP